MLLIPRQLRRTGMTGDVPYYGGRFTPAQAHAAAHPHAGGPAGPAPAGSLPTQSLRSLEQLRASGVITDAEYDAIRARVPR